MVILITKTKPSKQNCFIPARSAIHYQKPLSIFESEDTRKKLIRITKETAQL